MLWRHAVQGSVTPLIWRTCIHREETREGLLCHVIALQVAFPPRSLPILRRGLCIARPRVRMRA